MSNFRSAYDIKNGVLKRCGELTDGTSSFDDIALEYVNGIYQSIIAGSSEFELDLGEPWIWAKSKYNGVLVLNPPYETGTVSLTNGSVNGTFSSAPAASQANKWLKLTGRPEVFRIATHTAATTDFTLDLAYTDETITDSEYKAIELDYELTGGIQRLIGGMPVHRLQKIGEDNDMKIYEVGSEKLAEKWPLPLVEEGIPTHFAQIYEIDGKITVRFNKYVDRQTRIEYPYIPIPVDLRSYSFTDSLVTAGSDIITISGHEFTNGTPVSFTTTGTLPAGLSKDTLYYVVGASGSDFSVSTSLGGSAVDITAASGGGTHYVSTMPVLPREARVAIEYAATNWLMIDKNDDRAPSFFQLAQLKLRSMIEANRKENQMASKDRGRITPRPDMKNIDRVFVAGGTS